MDTKRTVRQPLDCHERALRLLAVRPRTRRELADHHLKVRGSGRRAVARALASKGVSRETIDATLAGIEDDESMRALEVATDRARRLSSLRPEVAYQRLVSFLARRGYDGGTCREAARAALGLDGQHG